MTGTIKIIVEDRGFGFIQPTASGKDLFFHCSDVQAPLIFDAQIVERRVEFTLVMRDGKERAIGVRPVD